MIKIILAFTFLAASFLMFSCTKREFCGRNEVIKTIGGCDKYAMCGVVYESGRSGMERYPVIGQHRSVCFSETDEQ